jgi:hypothetical protein
MAAVTAVVLPLRVSTSALSGLQDVKFIGVLSTVGWALDLILTVTLLFRGWGLYSLALGASIPSLVSVIAAFVRLHHVAPDLVRQWPRPSVLEVARLFKEGFGTWLGTWGWRLLAATDAIVVASLGNPQWITTLAMTAKLGQMLTQMSWVPGDSSLVGLAQLSGEARPERLRAAVSAVFRVYLALASAGACIVLAANGGFVRGWVGAPLFAGSSINIVLALIMIVGTVTHGLSTITSVLGHRMQVGVATLIAGAVQLVLALALGRALGLIGVPLAALIAQGLVLGPLLLPSLSARTGVRLRTFAADVVQPWALRSVPLLVLSALAGPTVLTFPIWIAVPIGGVVAAVYIFVARRLILDYAPVASMVRNRLSRFPLAAALLP